MKSLPVALVLAVSVCLLHAGAVSGSETESEITVHPVRHASFVMEASDLTLYVDPVGEPGEYAAFPRADIILVTHSHRDHLSREVIDAVKKPGTMIIANGESAAGLPGVTVLANGESTTAGPVTVEATPACNLTADRLKYHPRGRDNGYVVTLAGKRVYISGDTEDIPEMRALKNIDVAFVCMNLPYTMTVDQAASAVSAFRPRVVIPYHYKGPDGFSDLSRFKTLVSGDGSMEVRLLEWY